MLKESKTLNYTYILSNFDAVNMVYNPNELQNPKLSIFWGLGVLGLMNRNKRREA